MWKLRTDRGRQCWHFDESVDKDSKLAREQRAILERKFSVKDGDNADSADLVVRHLLTSREQKTPEKSLDDENLGDEVAMSSLRAARDGIRFYQKLQDDGGWFPNDYGGPMFLLPGLVIMCKITETEIEEHRRREILRYIKNHQNADGGWGLHIEMKTSTMFGTALQYVAARLLGAGEDEEFIVVARKFIHAHGGAQSVPPWGKFWLSVLGCYSWEGFNSIFPELWLLPEMLPIHPSRWWCHCRMVYLPMSYCFANRVTGPLTKIVRSLRKELYTKPYDSMDWLAARDDYSELDIYETPSPVMGVLNFVANTYERFAPAYFRRWSSNFLLEYIRAEDDQTKSVDIGPVNKVINALAIWHADGHDSKTFQVHIDRLWDYLWLAEDGMKMQGYNGSQLWDTAFHVMAVLETERVYPSARGLEFSETLGKSYHYMDITQGEEDVPQRERFYRHISKGGWPFSTKDHGWPIADCTAHALEAVLLCHKRNVIPTEKRIADGRLFDAVNILLSYQNTDGGWATYEITRGSPLLEKLNPAVVFDRIMIDYSYTELTSSVVQALALFRSMYPSHRTEEIRVSIDRGVKFIKDEQRSDGSWYGSWGVCFTYGAWFAIKGLMAAGEDKRSPVIRKACEFLVSKQQEDGGWGETFESSARKVYCQNEKSQIINTAWALLSLMAVDYADERPIYKGAKLLMSRQEADGDFPQEDIVGVFNANCMITYTAYRNIFPIWALGEFANKYANGPGSKH